MIEPPPGLARRPRDRRGYPITFITWINPETGVPDFRVTDAERLAMVLRRRLCGLCGVPLGGNVFFIGGPLSVESGAFTDPPMHRECARYALRVCPFLAVPKGRYSDPAIVAKKVPSAIRLECDEAVVAGKPTRFALLHTKRYRFEGNGRSGFRMFAALPWLDVQWWKDGEPET